MVKELGEGPGRDFSTRVPRSKFSLDFVSESLCRYSSLKELSHNASYSLTSPFVSIRS